MDLLSLHGVFPRLTKSAQNPRKPQVRNCADASHRPPLQIPAPKPPIQTDALFPSRFSPFRPTHREYLQHGALQRRTPVDPNGRKIVLQNPLVSRTPPGSTSRANRVQVFTACVCGPSSINRTAKTDPSASPWLPRCSLWSWPFGSWIITLRGVTGASLYDLFGDLLPRHWQSMRPA
jgi:hypothetical protein